MKDNGSIAFFDSFISVSKSPLKIGDGNKWTETMFCFSKFLLSFLFGLIKSIFLEENCLGSSGPVFSITDFTVEPRKKKERDLDISAEGCFSSAFFSISGLVGQLVQSYCAAQD